MKRTARRVRQRHRPIAARIQRGVRPRRRALRQCTRHPRCRRQRQCGRGPVGLCEGFGTSRARGPRLLRLLQPGRRRGLLGSADLW